MCRFVAYLGTPILLDELLFKPTNSLIHQSTHAREIKEPLNGDGFGVGWYNPEISPTPGVFVSTSPAWNNRNLQMITPKLRSGCFFAHIRAASAGGVTEYNCHPFFHDRLLFMHNGGIGGFTHAKRHIRHRLSDEIYDWVKGQTDSEHFFGLFLENFKQAKAHCIAEDMAKILEKTIQDILQIQNDLKINEASHLNIVISSGRNIVASRFIANPTDDNDQARTLYYAEGSELYTAEGICHLPYTNEQTNAVMVVSKKLDDHVANWHKVESNNMLIIRDDLTITEREIMI